MADTVKSSGAGNSGADTPTIAAVYAKLPAKDVERARAYYATTLGLSPFSEHDSHLHYEFGGTYFLVFPSRGEASGTHDQFGLVVDDVKATVALLRSRGVTFEEYPAPPGATVTDGIMDRGAVKAAWFKDSEGNLVSVAEFPNGAPFKRR